MAQALIALPAMMKLLYENNQAKVLAKQIDSVCYDKFVHVSELNSPYCPVAWVMGERILNKVTLDPNMLSKFVSIMEANNGESGH